MSRHRYKITCLTLWLVPVLFAAVLSPASEMGQIKVWSGRVVDPEGHPISGATVRILADGLSAWERDQLVESWSDPVEKTTDEDGTFDGATLRAPYTLRAEAPGWAPRTVRVDEELSSPVLEMERGRLITGEVVDSTSGESVPRARLTVCDREAALFGRVACREERADDEGIFIVDALSYSELRLGAVAPGRAISPLQRIPAGEEEVAGIVLRLDPGAGVAGSVVDHAGEPVAGARVRFLPEGRRIGDSRPTEPTWPVFSDDEGHFRHDGLKAGNSYEVRTVRADRPDATAGPLPIVAGRDVKELEIVMPAAARLVWQIAGSEDETIVDLELYLQEVDT